MTSKTANKFSPEVRDRAVRMVLDHEREQLDHEREHPSLLRGDQGENARQSG